MNEYPELEKLNKAQDDHAAIIEFIEWLRDEVDITLVAVDEYGGITPAPPLDNLIMQHFGINPVELERERLALLASLRKDH